MTDFHENGCGCETDAVMALSGGMDSTALLIHLLSHGIDVHAISFNYGQKHVVEIERASENINYLRGNGHDVSHQIIHLTSAMSSCRSALTDGGVDGPVGHYEEEHMKQTVVPNRNAIFASIIYGVALSIAMRKQQRVQISLGVHSGDHAIYPDCRPEFYAALARAFDVGNWESDNVRFDLPWIDGDKVTILRDAESAIEYLGLDFDTIFANTNTSYNPDDQGRASGTSGADVERILAFNAVGRVDPAPYSRPWDDVLADALQVEKQHRGE